MRATDANEPWSHWCSSGGSAACSPIRWLHIPKAGTSFGLAVYRYACSIPPTAHIPSPLECSTLPDSHPWRRSNVCKEHIFKLENALTESFPPHQHCAHLTMPFNGHGPAAPSDAGSLAAMFRSPLRRAMSTLEMMREHSRRGAPAWNFFKATGGSSCGSGRKGLCCPGLIESSPENTSLRDFYRLGGVCVAGCQTKMVLGHGCHAPVRLGGDDIKMACGMVLSNVHFRFVGVTEKWADSIALFHATHGGAVASAELENSRPTRERDAVEATMSWAHPNEAADEQLFECAQLRMLNDLVRVPGDAWGRHMRARGPEYNYTGPGGAAALVPISSRA